MARGKIQIRKIENLTNRQVTYSKRKNGLFKKARELTILCDARVSLIMFSGSGKVHEYISPPTTTKEIYDDYQKALGIDLWSSVYEKMQENLKKLQETNRRLRKAIWQRTGGCLEGLSIEDLNDLQENLERSVKLVRDRKFQFLGNQIETSKKKLRNAKDIHKRLLLEFDARNGDPSYGLVDNERGYDSVLDFSNGAPPLFAPGLQPNQPNLHGGTGSDLTTYALLE